MEVAQKAPAGAKNMPSFEWSLKTGLTVLPLCFAGEDRTITMGKLLSKIFGNKEMRILMLGLDAAGKTSILLNLLKPSHRKTGEHSGSVVEHQTPEREFGVRNLPPPCCVLEQDTFLPESTRNTQEAVAPSQHD